MHRLVIRDELVQLLPEKLVLLPGRKTLLVADTHFGKAATFRRAGIPVPVGTTASMLGRLSAAIDLHRAKRLIFLGDFLHSEARTQVDFVDELVAWRGQYRDVELVLVPGNHDRGDRQIIQDLEMTVQAEPFQEASFAFCHFFESNQTNDSFAFAGHVHPAVSLRESRNSVSRVACFAMSDDHMLLPAFGEFTGCHVVSPAKYPGLFAVTDERVMDVSRVVAESSSQ